MFVKKVFAILLACLFLFLSVAMAAEESTTVKPKEETSGGVVLDSKRYDYNHYEVVTNIEGDWNPFTVEEIDKALNSFANMIFALTKIVAQLIDTGLDLLYGLDFLDSWADKISKVAKTIYDNLYQSFAVMFFVLAVLQIFLYYMMERNGMKALKATGSLAAVIILAVVWFSNSDYFLKGLNSITDEAQGEVMKAGIALTDESVAEGEELAGSIAIVRNQYHDLIVRKPYLIMNYGTTVEENILKDDPNRIDKLLSTKTTKAGYEKRLQIVKEEARDLQNSYMTQSYIPMKIGIAFVSLIFSLLLGIPMLLIAFLNAGIQVLIMIIAIVLPISLMVSMLPKFANSGWYTFGRMAGLFFMKVFVGIFILLMFSITTIMYETIPMISPAHYMLNVVAVSMSIILMIKYRDKIVEFITAGQVTTVDGNTINNAYQKVRQGASEAKGRATEWVLNTATGGSASAYFESKRKLDQIYGEETEHSKDRAPLSQKRVSDEQRNAQRTAQPSKVSTSAETYSEEVEKTNRTPQQAAQETGTADSSPAVGPQEKGNHSTNIVNFEDYRERPFNHTPQVASSSLEHNTPTKGNAELEMNQRLQNEARIRPSTNQDSTLNRTNRTSQLVEQPQVESSSLEHNTPPKGNTELEMHQRLQNEDRIGSSTNQDSTLNRTNRTSQIVEQPQVESTSIEHNTATKGNTESEMNQQLQNEDRIRPSINQDSTLDRTNRTSQIVEQPQVESSSLERNTPTKGNTESEVHQRLQNEDRIRPSINQDSTLNRTNRTSQIVEQPSTEQGKRLPINKDKPITQWEAQQQINERNRRNESNQGEQQKQRDQARTPQRKVERQESEITSSNVSREP